MPKKPPPSLPLSAFSPVTPTTHSILHPKRSSPFITIDAHVFLPSLPDLDSHQAIDLWQDSVLPLHPRLSHQQSLSRPSLSTSDPNHLGPGLEGFVHMHKQPQWLQDNNINHHQPDSSLSNHWNTEILAIRRSDGLHSSFKVSPPLAQVVWAPLDLGPAVLAPFLDQLATTHTPIAGCCHLVQQRSPSRSASLVEPKFVDSLKLLGKRGLSLEFLVERNHERSASAILEEVLECVSAVREGQDPKEETKFVLCQMGMPEMISSQSLVPSSASYSSILSRLFSLSLFSNLQIKLSGLPLVLDEELVKRACDYFTRFRRPYQASTPETPAVKASNGEEEAAPFEAGGAGRAQGEVAWREVKKRIKFYLEPILEAFGDHRIMYASSFPYFEVHEATLESAKQPGRYEYQFEITKECLTEFGLENEALDNVFGLNAQRWYRK